LPPNVFLLIFHDCMSITYQQLKKGGHAGLQICSSPSDPRVFRQCAYSRGVNNETSHRSVAVKIARANVESFDG